MEVTVEQFLRIPLLKGARIVAGKTGANRIVKGLSLMDSICGYKYLDRGLLAVTSGYVLANEAKNADVVCEVIAQMAQRGLSGITLKAKYFNFCLPESLLRVADEWGFPIIQLMDSEMQFYRLFEYFNVHLFIRNLGDFLRLDTVSAVLINAITTKGLEQLAKQLYEWTGKSVSVVLKKSVLCYPPQAYLSELSKRLSNQFFSRFCQPDAAQREILHLRSSSAAASGIMFQYNLNMPGSIWLDEGEIACDGNDFAILRAAKLACEIGNRQIIAFEQDEEQLRTEIVEDILLGKLRSTLTTDLRLQKLNWTIPQKVQVVLIWSQFPADLVRHLELAIQKYLNKFNINIIECFINGQFVLLLPQDVEDPKQFISGLLEKLKIQWPRLRFRSYSGRLLNFRDTRTSYLQACLTQAVAKRKDSDYRTFDELGIFRLCQPEDSNEIRRICVDLLKPLLEFNTETDNDMLKTLRAFFHCKFNFSQTGQKLGIHPNTVRYRLGVVEKLCGVNLEDYDDVLSLQVALQLLPFLEIDASANWDE